MVGKDFQDLQVQTFSNCTRATPTPYSSKEGSPRPQLCWWSCLLPTVLVCRSFLLPTALASWVCGSAEGEGLFSSVSPRAWAPVVGAGRGRGVQSTGNLVPLYSSFGGLGWAILPPVWVFWPPFLQNGPSDNAALCKVRTKGKYD